MRCLYSPVKKTSLTTHIQKCILSSPLFLFLSHIHAHKCMRLSPHIHTLTCTHTQTVSCALPTVSSTKTERTACPCLTHIHTHTCAHTNSATSLYTLLKGHDTDLNKIPSCVTMNIALANNKKIKPEQRVIYRKTATVNACEYTCAMNTFS